MFFITLSIFSCHKDKISTTDIHANDSIVIPRLHAQEVVSLVSDSGITRYRLTTSLWDIYDHKPDSIYWEFTEGIHLERFDSNLVVDVNIQSKYAKYYEYKNLWELRGNVDVTNVSGERFQTELLFWDRATEQIYSGNSPVKITFQNEDEITATDFISNQTMSKYTFTSAGGKFHENESTSEELETSEESE